MATADWNPLGEVYLRKTELYSMGWTDVDLGKFVAVASCHYGGPIALLRDDSQTARVQVSIKPIITTYTAAGKQIGQMRWNSGQIVKMGWSVTEDLLCVQDDGVVLVYDFFLNFKRTFGLGQEAKDVKVIDCEIFNSFQGTGIAILTSTMRIFIINSIDDPRIRRLAEIPGLQTPPSSWTIINLDRQSRALVAKGNELYLIDHGGQFQIQSPQITSEVKEYLKMSVSYSNKYLAMFTDTGVLWIGSSDLQKCYCEFNTKSAQCPQQLAWCGSGAVVAMWDNLMLVVGPDKDWIKIDMSMTVCPYHRFTLGINWRRSTKCKNPGHEGKEKIHRSINVKLSKDVLYKLGYLLPVGSGVCKTCYGQIAEMVTDTAETSDKCENSSHKIEDSCNLVHGYELRPRTKSNYNEQSETVAVFQDGSQSPCETEMLSQTSNWSDEIHCQDSLEDLNQYLQKHSISPVKYPLRKNISDIQESTARYYKRKANEAIEDVLNAIAPGQSSSLLGLCVNKEPSTSQYDIEETVIRLYIETADANIRCQLLSSICTNLSKKELMGRIPGLTKYQVDKARMFAAEAGDKNIGLRVVPKKKFRRDRMGKDKLEHCLSFFFDNMFVQIVAHGVREMQLDSGETLEIPDVVRTAFHSTMVQMYEAFFRETNFEPLSTSSLFKILKACPASKRKNLHGLDNITADGISAYDTILEVAKRFNTHEIYKELERKIHESKFYMKTDYKTHIKDFDLCADHCRTYALSHPTDKSLQEICPHEHTIQCDRCNLLYEVEKALQELVDQEIDGTEKDVMKFDLKNAMKHILNWKAHIVRTTNQDQCRIDILDCLQPSQVLIVMDWAMKFLPIFFREKQSDWFAQKGKNWHVTVCITRDENGKLKHSTYTHVLESRQDWFAVFSILENVLSTLKTQKPHLEEAFIRSDNAGCYHCGHIWLALHEIRAKTGITIQRIDYSEPQAGKSYCDSKIAHMRSRLRTYAASGNDVSSLSDMKKAIDSNGGVVGCQVSVVEIDATQQHIKNHKWKGVNSVNHLAFENGGIRVWRMYKIGAGKLITADQVKTYCSQKQFQGGLKILEEFTVPSVAFGSITHKEHNPIGTLEGVPESVMRTSNNNDEQSEDEEEVADIFSCPEVGCSRVFKTYRGLESHILLGKHVLNLQKESTYDQIRRKWADCCNETKFGVTAAAGTSPDTSGQEVVACHLTMGWALKKERVATRFTENTREFLRNCFEEGEVTNKKANPHDVATKMKHLKDDNRHAVFKPEEWLLPGQIMSYFSRLTAQQGNQRRSVIECDEDMVAVMTALDDDNIRDCVINEIL